MKQPSRRPTGAELRTFRHKLAILKQAGVVHRVDARSAFPSSVRQGKKLSTWVDKYDDVISGKATAIPISKFPKSEQTKLRKEYDVADGFVQVPVSATEKAIVHGGKIEVVERLRGIHRVTLPVGYRDGGGGLKRWLGDIRKRAPELDKLKGDNRYWGYEITGHYSFKHFRSLGELATALLHGSTSGAGFGGNRIDWARLSRQQQLDLFKTIHIVAIDRASDWPKPPKRLKKKRKALKRRKRK